MKSNIIKQLKWRYATKKFDETKQLPEEKIAILKESFNLTATSYGLQPLKLVIINNTKTKNDLMPITMNQSQVKEASHVLVICIEKNQMNPQYIKDYFNLVEKTRNTPREILDPFQDFMIDSFSEKKPEAITTWKEKQAYLALGNLLTVCALENIDACPIEGFEPEKYDEFLHLSEKGLQSVLVLAVGYRAEDDFFASLKKVRKGVENVVIEFD